MAPAPEGPGAIGALDPVTDGENICHTIPIFITLFFSPGIMKDVDLFLKFHPPCVEK